MAHLIRLKLIAIVLHCSIKENEAFSNFSTFHTSITSKLTYQTITDLRFQQVLAKVEVYVISENSNQAFHRKKKIQNTM